MGCNRRKLEDERKALADAEAAAGRVTDAQVHSGGRLDSASAAPNYVACCEYVLG